MGTSDKLWRHVECVVSHTSTSVQVSQQDVALEWGEPDTGSGGSSFGLKELNC